MEFDCQGQGGQQCLTLARPDSPSVNTCKYSSLLFQEGPCIIEQLSAPHIRHPHMVPHLLHPALAL